MPTSSPFCSFLTPEPVISFECFGRIFILQREIQQNERNQSAASFFQFLWCNSLTHSCSFLTLHKYLTHILNILTKRLKTSFVPRNLLIVLKLDIFDDQQTPNSIRNIMFMPVTDISTCLRTKYRIRTVVSGVRLPGRISSFLIMSVLKSIVSYFK